MKNFDQVILIDDDSVNNFLNTRVLKNSGLSKDIQIFLNGEEAIHYLEWNCIQQGKKCPDLILLDLNMPVMNGFEFLNIYNKLKFKKDHVEIVVLTSSQDDRDMRKVQSYGINHYLNKPLIKENFKNFLDKLSGTPVNA